MAMGKVPGQDPDAYVQDEVIEWGHLADPSNGPVLVIRAEESRVLSGFRRGQRLRTIEPRLKPGGKDEMATLDLREGLRSVRRSRVISCVGPSHERGRCMSMRRRFCRSRLDASIPPTYAGRFAAGGAACLSDRS